MKPILIALCLLSLTASAQVKNPQYPSRQFFKDSIIISWMSSWDSIPHQEKFVFGYTRLVDSSNQPKSAATQRWLDSVMTPVYIREVLSRTRDYFQPRY